MEFHFGSVEAGLEAGDVDAEDAGCMPFAIAFPSDEAPCVELPVCESPLGIGVEVGVSISEANRGRHRTYWKVGLRVATMNETMRVPLLPLHGWQAGARFSGSSVPPRAVGMMCSISKAVAVSEVPQR